jgi:hypothetical protein
MDKNGTGFGFGAKTDNEQKRDELRNNWGSKKSTTKGTDERAPVGHWPSYDVQETKIADIKITGRRRALNPDKLKELAASISTLGLQSPITVRLVKRDLGWGKTKTELVLVSGLHRLEAMKQLGQTTIPSFIIKGGKRVARMSEIVEQPDGERTRLLS